ncbi:MAG: LpqB family beta-propeller domain-containing protein, partial [Gemmatimonadales bacterium]
SGKVNQYGALLFGAAAVAEANRVPRLSEISRATTRFPGGETVYAYGGLIFDYLSRTRGPDKIGKFIDETSKIILPLSLNARAKRVFGISFENAWRDWRDSLVRVSGASRDPMPGWTELTHDGRYVEFPRWLGDTAILYSAANGREVTSAYAVSLRGKVERIGRRNGLGVNVPLSDGSIVFSQPDYIDPFHLRTDLYVQKHGEQRRLTRGARLTQPDVRANGDIVAVQSVPGSTRLVRVSPDGRSIVPITVGDAAMQWGEPRWSPDGKSIAALRVRDGHSEIVVLPEGGSEASVLVSERAILATPSWSASGRTILYTSTRSGTTQAYRIELPSDGSVAQMTSASTGVFNPEASPDGRYLVALGFKFDGYHIGIGIPQTQRVEKSTEGEGPRASCTNCRLAEVRAPISLEQVPAPKKYSPWQSLAPRYWEPIVGHAPSSGYEIGAATSGEDIIGRHAFYAQALYKTKFRESEAFAAYQYAGLGQPYVNFSASQEWDHFSVVNNAGNRVGELARRARIGGMSLSLVRPRARTSASFSIGGDVESRTYSTNPDTLLARLPEVFGKTRAYPSLFTSASWVNTKRPGLAISREDGISLSATARQRWESGDISNASRSVVGVAGLFKSLDLPGFAHHVIAARLAGGYADRRAISSFSVGGLSGGSLAVLAGVTVGDDRRTFGVRGFPPSAEQGIRALGGTVEYRAPIAAPSKRVPFIPVLFDRISVSAFGEGGRAFCPASAGANQICAANRGGPFLASAGGELDFDTALQYDVPTRFRIGVAVPVHNREAGNAEKASFYFTVGSSF